MAGARRKFDLYSWACISAIEEVWLMHKADAQSTLERKKEVQTGRQNVLSSCFVLKCEYLFHH